MTRSTEGHSNRLRAAVLAVLVAGAVAPAGSAVAAPTAASPYVALGDSYAAGPLVPPPDPAPPAGCQRSLFNYPHLVAMYYRMTDFRDVSCAGAKTDDMFSPQAVNPGPNPPQLDAVHAGARIVTLQVGGNDIGFSELATNCAALLPLGTPCRDRYAPGGVDQIAARIAATRPKVDAVLAAIKAKAPAARVYLVGYPSILPENSGGCWPVMPYTPLDVPYLVSVEKQLNDMLRQSAEANGAAYVDLYTPSLGHDACQVPGVRWVEPVIAPVAAAPVHPNVLGMIVAQSLLIATLDATVP